MKSKICALVAIAALIVFMGWECFTRPVVEMDVHWVEAESDSRYIDANLAARTPIERTPMTGEVIARGVFCGASLLVGIALVRILRSK